MSERLWAIRGKIERIEETMSEQLENYFGDNSSIKVKWGIPNVNIEMKLEIEKEDLTLVQEMKVYLDVLTGKKTMLSRTYNKEDQKDANYWSQYNPDIEKALESVIEMSSNILADIRRESEEVAEEDSAKENEASPKENVKAYDDDDLPF